MRKLILILFLSISLHSLAQIGDSSYYADPFFDECSKLLDAKKTDSSILFTTNKALYEIDLDANLIWTSINHLNYHDENSFKNAQIIKVDSDSVLISVLYKNSFRFIQIERSSGKYTLRYEKILQFYGNQSIVVTDSFIFLGYYAPSGLAFITRLDRNFNEVEHKQLTFIKEYSSVNIDLEIDQNNNLYALTEDSLYKFNGLELRMQLWRIGFKDISNNALYNLQLIMTKNGSIIVVNYLNNSTYLNKIDKKDGTAIWTRKDQSYDASPIQFYDDFDHLYYVSKHRSVGSGIGSSYVAKIELEGGDEKWLSGLKQQTLGTQQLSNGRWQSFLDLNADCNGNIVATGYYGSANFGPGAWGISILDSSNASLISSYTITNDSINYDLYSTGRFVLFFKDTAYLLGELEMSDWKTAVTVVKHLPSNKIEWKRSILDSLVEKSRINYISSESSDYYFLVEHGSDAVALKRNGQNQKLWEASNSLLSENNNFSQFDHADLVVAETSSILLSKKTFNSNASKVYVQEIKNNNGAISLVDSLEIADYALSLVGGLSVRDTVIYLYHANEELFGVVIASGKVIVNKKLFSVQNINSLTKPLLKYYNNELRIILGSYLQSFDLNLINTSSIRLPSLSKCNAYADYLDTVYFAGIDQGKSYLGAIHHSQDSMLFEVQTNGNSFDKMLHNGSNQLIILGEEAGNSVLQSFNTTTRSFGWKTVVNPFSSFKANGMTYNPLQQTITVYGEYNDNNTSSFAFKVYNRNGIELYTISKEDETGNQSEAISTSVLSDSSIVIGGIHNKKELVLSAFLYRFYISNISYAQINSVNANFSNVLVYPNPATDKLFIQKSLMPKAYKVYNLNGKMVLEDMYNPATGIDLSTFSNGTYFIGFDIDSWNYRTKFIISR